VGMFDNVKCSAPLPEPSMQDRTFQTKSLDCELADYEITKDGELWKVGGYFHEGERERVELHGDVTFCDWETENPRPPYGELVYFTARFTEGKLSRIWRL
jgi:hypothetical protein